MIHNLLLGGCIICKLFYANQKPPLLAGVFSKAQSYLAFTILAREISPFLSKK